MCKFTTLRNSNDFKAIIKLMAIQLITIKVTTNQKSCLNKTLSPNIPIRSQHLISNYALAILIARRRHPFFGPPGKLCANLLPLAHQQGITDTVPNTHRPSSIPTGRKQSPDNNNKTTPTYTSRHSKKNIHHRQTKTFVTVKEVAK